MNHPRIRNDGGGLPSTSDVPWSAEGERRLHQLVILNGLVGVFLLVAFLVMGIWQQWIAAAVFLIVAAWALAKATQENERLALMVLNRPRTTAGLTRWVSHDWEADVITCECGRRMSLDAAPWFAETNRHAVVCVCGIGHYKLRRP